MSPTLSHSKADFPLFLAPMAGVTDVIFRQLCKEYGADVLTTEFVSAAAIHPPRLDGHAPSCP